MRKVTKVICEGREFTVYQDKNEFVAIERGQKTTLRRDDKEACIQAIIDAVNIDKIVEETGMNRLDAITKYYFGQ